MIEESVHMGLYDRIGVQHVWRLRGSIRCMIQWDNIRYMDESNIIR